MTNLFLVGLGGFLGSISRYFFGGFIQGMFHTLKFPYGTLTVNIGGCFFIGLLYGLGEAKGFLTPELRLFLGTGFLGGFTTFSTFGYETLSLTKYGEPMSAMINILLHMVLCLGAVWAGDLLSRIL